MLLNIRATVVLFRGLSRTWSKGWHLPTVLEAPADRCGCIAHGRTTIGRARAAAKFPTEEELEACFIERMRAASGMVLVWCSGQNIDRLVTVYKACRKTRKQFVIDMYTAEILRAIGNPKLPQGDGLASKSFCLNRRSFKSSGSDCLDLPRRIRPPAFSRSSWHPRRLTPSCSFGRQCGRILKRRDAGRRARNLLVWPVT